MTMANDLINTKLIVETTKGNLIKVPVTLRYVDGRIEFVKSPFALKSEIKAMAGSRWHGYIEGDKRKIWSVADCPRNRFQLGYLEGKDVYEWFDRDLVRHEYRRPLMPHQRDMADAGLTYHFQIWAAEMGCGKTLSAQEVMERSGAGFWYWVGPKTSLPNIRREFRKWNMDPAILVEMMTYEALVRKVDDWKDGDQLPQGVIFDESSKLKTPTAQRSKAAQSLADMIRAEYGFDGYVILMSGTPSPKSPINWWSQAEIAWPGFLREGSVKALEQRLAFMADKQFDAGVFKKRIGWKDDESKCGICGETEIEGPHELDGITDPDDYHEFVPSKNEVAYMYERFSGLVIIKHKKDCLALPEKRYRKIVCKPTASTLRVAQAIAASAPNVVTGMTLLRELSDGFQYREVKDGKTKCPHCPESCGTVHEWFDPEDEDRTFRAIDMLDETLVSRLEKREVDCPRCAGSGEVDRMKRIVREVPCPKTKALKGLLEENEEVGRIVIFAGFTGSVDRVTGICRKDGWDVVRCDGRGFQVTTHDGQVVSDVDPLDYWSDLENNPRVAFVAHPESGGMSLTLVEARTAVYWSNSFKPEYRAQSEDRIHRKGLDENLGCTIVDLIHLPTDERVLEVIRENRRLEKMTMGDFSDALAEEAAGEDETPEVVDAC
jgi:SNF2 family DNA or RNA helicase